MPWKTVTSPVATITDEALVERNIDIQDVVAVLAALWGQHLTFERRRNFQGWDITWPRRMEVDDG